MLDMGFIPDVRSIVRKCPHPERRQTLLFSATFNDSILRLVQSWQVDPHKVEIDPENLVTDLVEQKFYTVSTEEKQSVIFWTMENEDVERMLIFVNRKDTGIELYKSLYMRNVECALLSGDVMQKKRMRVLEEFREGKIKVIVATDVAARGIHVDNVSHVINFELPYDADDYVHRIGRTGRAGSTGRAISLVDEYGAYHLHELEEYLKEEIKSELPPDEVLDYKLPEPSREEPKIKKAPDQNRKKGRRGSGHGGNRRQGNRSHNKRNNGGRR